MPSELMIKLAKYAPLSILLVLLVIFLTPVWVVLAFIEPTLLVAGLDAVPYLVLLVGLVLLYQGLFMIAFPGTTVEESIKPIQPGTSSGAVSRGPSIEPSTPLQSVVIGTAQVVLVTAAMMVYGPISMPF